MNGVADLLASDDADGPPQERRLQILSEACRLFAARGFDGVSIRDIAAECGISKATLYHYFPDKDAILRPLILGSVRTLYERVARALDPADPALVRLRVFMLETARYFEQFRWAWIVSSSVFWNDPQARHQAQRLEWRDRYEALLRSILQDAVDRGEVRPLDVSLAGRLVLSTLNWLPRWYDPGGPANAVEIADGFFALVVDGLRAPGSPQ